MHWLFLLFALGLMAVALRTSSLLLMGICLLASLGLFVAWVIGWYAARMGDVSGNESQMIDPVELRRLRELAEARKSGTAPPTAHGEPPSKP
ncbi:MAG: hypothetical protein LH491_01665 [Pseudoxanthomonas sp.]|nr:hypothetical protein [Pseudoxanthomonas sp.]